MLLFVLIVIVFIILALMVMHLRRFFYKAVEYEILEQYYANVLHQGLNPDYRHNPYLLMDFKYPLFELKNTNLVSRWSYSTETLTLKPDQYYRHANDSVWIIGKKGLTVDLYIWNLEEHFEKRGEEGLMIYGMKERPDIEYISIVVPENSLLSIPRYWFFSFSDIENVDVYVSKSPISKIGGMIKRI